MHTVNKINNGAKEKKKKPFRIFKIITFTCFIIVTLKKVKKKKFFFFHSFIISL
jgi:hypothetical protein